MGSKVGPGDGSEQQTGDRIRDEQSDVVLSDGYLLFVISLYIF